MRNETRVKFSDQSPKKRTDYVRETLKSWPWLAQPVAPTNRLENVKCPRRHLLIKRQVVLPM